MNRKVGDTRRLYEDLVQHLTAKIHSGEIANGSLLPSERQLTEMFGVSRTVVQKALVSLQASGLISVRSSRRALVTQMDNAGFFNQLTSAAHSLMARPHGMSDFEEARTFFECGMARHAARYASPKEIEGLRAALEKNKKAVADATLFRSTSLEFHKLLAEIPRNGIFTACYSAIIEWMQVQSVKSLKSRTPRMAKAIYEKREAVFQAIAARDADAADRAMSNLLELSNEIYRKAAETD